MPCTLDHFVVAAASLEEGAAWVEDKLAVSLSPGGQHIKMGTHNKLLRLGEAAYIEVIAVDPTLPAPGRPRWFGLDDPAISSKIKPPRLLTWAVRTGDINALAAKSPFPTGSVHAMSRGALNWFLTIPDDGGLTLDGAYPFAIEWLGSQHPAQKLPHRGLSIQSMEFLVPDVEAFNHALEVIGFEKDWPEMKVTQAPYPALTLHLKTPRGAVALSSARPLSQNPADTGEARSREVGEP